MNMSQEKKKTGKHNFQTCTFCIQKPAEKRNRETKFHFHGTGEGQGTSAENDILEAWQSGGSSREMWQGL